MFKSALTSSSRSLSKRAGEMQRKKSKFSDNSSENRDFLNPGVYEKEMDEMRCLMEVCEWYEYCDQHHTVINVHHRSRKMSEISAI